MTEIFKQRIHDAVNACQAILNFTEAAAFDDYSENLMLRSAVERQFEILGEALNRANEERPDLAEQIPDIPRIVGMRNRIIHGYDSVDDEIVWDAIHNNIPSLLAGLCKSLPV